MDAGRLGRDEKLGGYLPVAAPGRDQAEHLEFAVSEAELAIPASRRDGAGRDGAGRRVVAPQPDPGAPREQCDLLAERARGEPGRQRDRTPQPLRRAVAVAAG